MLVKTVHYLIYSQSITGHWELEEFLQLLLLPSISEPKHLFHLNASFRYVPIKDLLRIYDNLYGRKVITENVIVDCTYLQFLEM